MENPQNGDISSIFMDPTLNFHDVKSIAWHHSGTKFASVHDKFTGTFGCDRILLWDTSDIKPGSTMTITPNTASFRFVSSPL
jgi:hypothetical protein